MPTYNLKFAGLRFSVFGDSSRIGAEIAAPRPRFRGASAQPPQDAAVSPPQPDVGGDLATRIKAIEWYHTLDLGNGLVTPGFYDHRPILERYGLPQRLDGLRVLDIAAFDGFWSFEFERRGAAEVVALDIASAAELDLAPRVRAAMTEAQLNRSFGAGFQLAHAHYGSKVRHVHCNVYGMKPADLGRFDLVHCGDLLLHLRDPLLALTRIREMTKGQALISDCIFPDLDRHDGAVAQYDGGVNDNIWWRLGANALSRMIRDAGFDKVEEVSRFRYGPRGRGNTLWHVVYRATVG
jgi:tRNA (mo5U34)-methyltransferase